MKLVIAEKPSVAQSIAAVLGAKQRGGGYLEGSGWLVSWCFGHLAELASAESYNPEYAKWKYDDLPIVPETWRFKVSRDKWQQFDILKKLMHSEDVSEVVNACDAGREGELIFRTAYCLAGCSKPMKRLWISSMEDSAIRDGFAHLRPGSDYDGLHQSALCRSKADWLVGINATRLFSVLYHRTLNVGRVMSPTLALIVQREAEIDAFRAEPFYTVELDVGFPAVSEKFREESQAKAVAAACQGQPAAVKSVERKEKSEKAPALYDLTTLQRNANRLLGYTAQQTLDYLQSLYEKKLCTYPRTDARFLTDDMEGSVPALVSVAATLYEAAAPGKIGAAQICDSKNVSDHHALVPTVSAGKAALSALPAGERKILRLVSRQLLCAVSEACRYAETVAAVECGGSVFTAKGRTVLAPGWKNYIQQEQPEKPLPDLTDGQALTVSGISTKEGKMTPPKHYTEDTLLSAMEVAGAKETPDDAERKGLGTPATRAAILEKLVSTGFVERKKAKKTVSLMPSHTGVSLITVLPEQLQSPLLTAEWEQKLKQVERGELTADAFLDGITAMLRELVKTYKAIKGAEVLFPSGREVVGKCPRCGGDVTESKKGFFCESADCRFGLWRDNKFLTAKRAVLDKKAVTALLKTGRVAMTGLYSEKTGKTYDATLVLEDDGQRANFKLEFNHG
ncbi:DNA topoisomerase III [Oscillibacter valericigenes Sjm18-20]|nr:DNA topoisomerase III [Oscillibacter valericigenes Sjm18-20]